MAEKFETINEDGNDVKCLAYRNQLDEADFVADHCRKLIQNGWNPGDIAVLYRINAMSEPIERSMTKSGIDYAVIGSRSFYDRKEIKDCLAMLRIAVNPNDSIAFDRCANHIPNLGEKTVAKIDAYANENDTTMIDACYRVAENSKAKKAIYHLIDKLDFDKTNMNVAQVLSESINRFEYKDKLRKEYESEAEERIENINQLLNSAAEFAEENPTKSATKYLQTISLITASDKEGDENRVSLMTMHASKGLEFPVVFVIGMEQNTSPHSLALKDDPVSGVEEERRLAYVAFTRAQSLLYVTYCRYRRQFSKGGSPWNKPCKPSQFLSEASLIKSKERERSGVN
jgi:DNA helicase-2/ATP-dependent DNA helicase PcrA